MTGRIASFYERLGIPPTCSDTELRKAYIDLISRVHPDSNPQDPEATQKAQIINEAYAELKGYRARGASFESDFSRPFSFSFRRDGTVDIAKVANIKARFKSHWEAFRERPTDPLRALRFIHAAFEAEQGDSAFLPQLLTNPILIDLAASLVSEATGAGQYARYATLTRWARYLQSVGRIDDAIQILEDSAAASGTALANLKDELRSHHYAAAQYAHPTTGVKAVPKLRIGHLRRIVALGYDLGYVHKLLAEAFHELGDTDQARASLVYAYQIDPQLSGAVRITRALGLLDKAINTRRKSASPEVAPRWISEQQIPSTRQIRHWAECQDWNLILDFAKPGDYSRPILPAARGTLRTIAVCLGNSGLEAAEPTLLELLDFDYYWDVVWAATTALSKVGGTRSLAALEEYRTKNNYGDRPHVKNCISYLRGRIEGSKALVGGYDAALLAQAKQAIEHHDYGLSRFFLENLVKHIGRGYPDFIEASALWACSCAEMNDFESAIEIVRPIYADLRDGGDPGILSKVRRWLWSAHFSEEYQQDLDEAYQWALELNLDLISRASTPDDLLAPLHSTTRWLEKLGHDVCAAMIRELIRKEAPGTIYVDSHDRRNYIRRVALTEKLDAYLRSFDVRIKTEVVEKLKEVMRSERLLGRQTPFRRGDINHPMLDNYGDSPPRAIDPNFPSG